MQKSFKDPKTGRTKVQTVFETIDKKTGEVVPVSPEAVSLTRQEFQKQTDINHIMKQYENMGVNYNQLPHDTSGIYADLTVIPKDYQETLQKLSEAQDAFMSLPPELRAQYNNNPQNLVDWLAKPENNDKAVELGLKVKKEAPSQPQASAPAPAAAADAPKAP